MWIREFFTRRILWEIKLLFYKINRLEKLIMSLREEFSQEITELGTSIDELSTRIGNLPSDVNDLTQADLDAVKSAVDKIQSLAVAAPEVPTDPTTPGDGSDTPAPVV